MWAYVAAANRSQSVPKPVDPIPSSYLTSCARCISSISKETFAKSCILMGALIGVISLGVAVTYRDGHSALGGILGLYFGSNMVSFGMGRLL